MAEPILMHEVGQIIAAAILFDRPVEEQIQKQVITLLKSDLDWRKRSVPKHSCNNPYCPSYRMTSKFLGVVDTVKDSLLGDEDSILPKHDMSGLREVPLFRGIGSLLPNRCNCEFCPDHKDKSTHGPTQDEILRRHMIVFVKTGEMLCDRDDLCRLAVRALGATQRDFTHGPSGVELIPQMVVHIVNGMSPSSPTAPSGLRRAPSAPSAPTGLRSALPSDPPSVSSNDMSNYTPLPLPRGPPPPLPPRPSQTL